METDGNNFRKDGSSIDGGCTNLVHRHVHSTTPVVTEQKHVKWLLFHWSQHDQRNLHEGMPPYSLPKLPHLPPQSRVLGMGSLTDQCKVSNM